MSAPLAVKPQSIKDMYDYIVVVPIGESNRRKIAYGNAKGALQALKVRPSCNP
jgi:hypothetical protein